MSHRLFALLPVLLLVGCSADSDGDGLTNKDEEELGLDPESADSDNDGVDDAAEIEMGSDPLVADTDGDGLLDGEEVTAGSDPQVVDTDGDGYTDRDEVFEGHDPADADDVIYKGGWPYYFEKDEISGGATFGEGKRFQDFVFKDQFGDEVHLHDFYNQDKYVILDISAGWCGPCNTMAAWLEGENETYAEFNGIREAVEAGDIYWITILGDGWTGPAGKPEATQWYNLYPNPNVPVLADHDQESLSYIQLQYFPSTLLLTPQLKLDTYVNGNQTVALAAALDKL